MPILDTRHDLAHPVEGDTAWSESYYFNAYDPETDSGLFSRIGIRPNEGTMDVGMSLWLPGGELGEYRWVKEQRDMVDTVLDVGAVRYEMLEALQSWRLTMEDAVQARPTGKSRAEAEAEAHPVKVALDVRFDAITPAVGTDGQPGGGPKSKEAAAASGTVGKGHLEQAGRVWDGTRATSVAEWRVRTELEGDGVTHRVVHLDVVDKSGRTFPLRGDVLRIAPIGQAGGTLVNEGLARWTYEGESGGGPLTGYGIAEYLHQLDDGGRPVVPVE